MLDVTPTRFTGIMDKIIMIAAAVAVIIVLGATFLILNDNPAKTPGNTADEGDETHSETDEGPDDRPVRTPSGNYTNATYGEMSPQVSGDCKLYQNVETDRLACFGRAGNYSTLATNEYQLSNSTDYFCKATVYGCRLYQKVTFEIP
jgi:hypothetical protein